MISIARIFGAPDSVPAGKVADQGVEGVLAGRELADHRAHDVLDVAVPLEDHLLRDAHAAEAADAAHVVAAQVHEHDVLGALLLVGQELCARRSSSSGVAPRGRVPAIGRSRPCRPSTRTSISGEAPAIAESPSFRKYMYGDGLTIRRAR